MGMYDTFTVKGSCPSCGEKLDLIQSKSFNCNLDTYDIGDAINFDSDMYIEKGFILEHNYCECAAKTKINIIDGKYHSFEFLKDKTGF